MRLQKYNIQGKKVLLRHLFGRAHTLRGRGRYVRGSHRSVLPAGLAARLAGAPGHYHRSRKSDSYRDSAFLRSRRNILNT